MLIYVYRLRRDGQKLGRLLLSQSRPVRGDLRLRWYTQGSGGDIRGPVAQAQLLNADGHGIEEPLEVFRMSVRASGMLLVGMQMSFRSSRPKAKAGRMAQSWFCAPEPLDLKMPDAPPLLRMPGG